ncbi:hypothetical protein QOT17_002960 [Balamuthia mandrillaris]
MEELTDNDALMKAEQEFFSTASSSFAGEEPGASFGEDEMLHCQGKAKEEAEESQAYIERLETRLRYLKSGTAPPPLPSPSAFFPSLPPALASSSSCTSSSCASSSCSSSCSSSSSYSFPPLLPPPPLFPPSSSSSSLLLLSTKKTSNPERRQDHKTNKEEREGDDDDDDTVMMEEMERAMAKRHEQQLLTQNRLAKLPSRAGGKARSEEEAPLLLYLHVEQREEEGKHQHQQQQQQALSSLQNGTEAEGEDGEERNVEEFELEEDEQGFAESVMATLLGRQQRHHNQGRTTVQESSCVPFCFRFVSGRRNKEDDNDEDVDTCFQQLQCLLF